MHHRPRRPPKRKPKPQPQPDHLADAIKNHLDALGELYPNTPPETRKKPGPKPKQFDQSLIMALAKIQCSMAEIGEIVGCSVDTLERRYQDVIDKGRLLSHMSLRRRQYEAAMAGNTGMLVWLGKQYLGQADKVEQKVEEKRRKPGEAPWWIEEVTDMHPEDVKAIEKVLQSTGSGS